ncbi:hypothetical protein E3U44_07765 [Nitrosococcus wardiae]|uniref:Uncharacterized protein n=1 Tax=Nitrosococcus wardiae TaxID=1814290 RepID=A0A4P7C0Y4_9GAMM|nr:hypothetical protein E3U44_07765 [Nitrosococcus wardiae]
MKKILQPPAELFRYSHKAFERDPPLVFTMHLRGALLVAQRTAQSSAFAQCSSFFFAYPL